MISEIKKKDWFKDRGYLHLTNRINLSERPKVFSYLTNSDKIARHKFSPFIFRTIKNRRYKFSKDLGRRSHKTIDENGDYISNAKIRPIMYATHIDSHIYSYYSKEIIQPLYEKELSKNDRLNESITAYRQIVTLDGERFKFNVDFAKEGFDEIKLRGNCGVLAFDIKNFFPSLDHKKLKLIWASLLGCNTLPKDHYNIYKSITRFSYFYFDDLRQRKNGNLDEKQIAHLKNVGKFQLFESVKDFVNSDIQVYKNQKKTNGKIAGIPQGLPISAMLANLYMLPFDQLVIQELVNDKGCYYRRYSDDLIIVCEESLVEEIAKFIHKAIEEINLVIEPSKTERYIFKTEKEDLRCFKVADDNLVPNSYLLYLGFEFYGFKTLLKASNISEFYREMKESIRIKRRRIDSAKIKYLTDNETLYKRKIYRLFTYRGRARYKRYLPAKRISHNGVKLTVVSTARRYRGNFIKYAYKASDILNAPEIRRQVRRHNLILKNYLHRNQLS
ncbi:MAG: reverse transcriptase domain-containing protein [Cyclobacteriaceae bacterium]